MKYEGKHPFGIVKFKNLLLFACTICLHSILITTHEFDPIQIDEPYTVSKL